MVGPSQSRPFASETPQEAGGRILSSVELSLCSRRAFPWEPWLWAALQREEHASWTCSLPFQEVRGKSGARQKEEAWIPLHLLQPASIKSLPPGQLRTLQPALPTAMNLYLSGFLFLLMVPLTSGEPSGIRRAPPKARGGEEEAQQQR